MARLLLILKLMDFSQRPFTVIWETTRSCDLACLHCRAEVDSQRNSTELTFKEAQGLIQSVKVFAPSYPILILTGSEPVRSDPYCIYQPTAWKTPLDDGSASRRRRSRGLM